MNSEFEGILALMFERGIEMQINMESLQHVKIVFTYHGMFKKWYVISLDKIEVPFVEAFKMCADDYIAYIDHGKKTNEIVFEKLYGCSINDVTGFPTICIM